ncbi:unnamed protein product, partial [marine sediment metagenome]
TYFFVPWQLHVYVGWFSCVAYQGAFDLIKDVKKFAEI